MIITVAAIIIENNVCGNHDNSCNECACKERSYHLNLKFTPRKKFAQFVYEQQDNSGQGHREGAGGGQIAPGLQGPRGFTTPISSRSGGPH